MHKILALHEIFLICILQWFYAQPLRIFLFRNNFTIKIRNRIFFIYKYNDVTLFVNVKNTKITWRYIDKLNRNILALKLTVLCTIADNDITLEWSLTILSMYLLWLPSCYHTLSIIQMSEPRISRPVSSQRPSTHPSEQIKTLLVSLDRDSLEKARKISPTFLSVHFSHSLSSRTYSSPM